MTARASAPPPSWVARAAAAAIGATTAMPEVEPLRAAMIRRSALLGTPLSPSALLRFWQSRTAGTVRSEARYRWELGHRIGVPTPTYAGPASTWRAWRSGDQPRVDREPYEVEQQLLLPVVLAENAELLLEVDAAKREDAALARELFVEAAPILRRDFARYVQMADPWADVFALYYLTRLPRVLSTLHPLAVAIAASYAASGEGPVLGLRFPYHQQILVSATAALASALLTLGSDLEYAARLSEVVRGARRPSGAWGDANEPDDPLTTLLCADLLGRIDPTFDAAPTLERLGEMQGRDGLFRALGPDAPWTTAQIALWAKSASRPFGARFEWPHRAEAIRDHKTGLPFFAYFADLADLFATMPGLASAPVEIGFIDLIGFRAFNNRFGQDAGDRVLREFAREISGIVGTCAIRDGGDELLVIGPPAGPPLRPGLDAMRSSWPARFHAAFGDDVPPVAPRVIVACCAGRDLRRAREELGRRITDLKNDPSAHPTEGLLVDAGAI